jgi:hypothetical protein
MEDAVAFLENDDHLLLPKLVMAWAILDTSEEEAYL